MPVRLLRSVFVVLGLSAFVVSGDAGTASADPVVPGEEHCVVNVRSDDALNLRSAPESGAAVVARKRYGACGIVVTGA